MPTVTPGLDASKPASSPPRIPAPGERLGSRGSWAVILRDLARRGFGRGATEGPLPATSEPEHGPDSDLHPELDRALHEGAVLAHFQPIVELDTGCLDTVETLARWPRGEVLTLPHVFLPVATRTGLLPLLTEHMLRVGTGQLARWRAEGRAERVRVAVNVPPSLIIDRGLVDVVSTVLDDVGLAPDGLVLEITEEAVPADLDAASSVVSALRAIGVQVALDDVGAGCSSLAVLHRLPVDAVKLDKCLVRDVDTDPALRRLVGQLVSLSLDLGLSVVAEGIQRDRQVRVLRDMGCTLGQGYLFGPAVPHQGCEPWLARPTPRPPHQVGRHLAQWAPDRCPRQCLTPADCSAGQTGTVSVAV